MADSIAPTSKRCPVRNGRGALRCGATWSFYFHECPDCAAITRAGRLLDGRTWDQMPGVQA